VIHSAGQTESRISVVRLRRVIGRLGKVDAVLFSVPGVNSALHTMKRTQKHFVREMVLKPFCNYN
jgi:hypothetical protein